MTLVGFGDSLNWYGSVEAAFTNITLNYVLYELPINTSSPPIVIPLANPISLKKGDADELIAAGIITNWDSTHNAKKPVHDPVRKQILRFPANPNVDRLHVLEVGTPLRRIAVQNTPVEVLPGLFVWVGALKSAST